MKPSVEGARMVKGWRNASIEKCLDQCAAYEGDMVRAGEVPSGQVRSVVNVRRAERRSRLSAEELENYRARRRAYMNARNARKRAERDRLEAQLAVGGFRLTEKQRRARARAERLREEEPLEMVMPASLLARKGGAISWEEELRRAREARRQQSSDRRAQREGLVVLARALGVRRAW